MAPGDLVYVRFGTSFLLSAPFDRSVFAPEDIEGRLCVILKECPQMEIETKSENCFVILVRGTKQIIMRKYLKFIPSI
jgi:hypothetical protein